MLPSGRIHPSAALADSVFHCGFLLLHLQSVDAHQAHCYVTAQRLQQRHSLLSSIMLLHSATSAVFVQVKATKQLSCGCHTSQGHDCSKVKHHSVLSIVVPHALKARQQQQVCWRVQCGHACTA